MNPYIDIVSELINKFIGGLRDFKTSSPKYPNHTFIVRAQAPHGKSAIAEAVRHGMDRFNYGWVWWIDPQGSKHWVCIIDKSQKIVCMVNNQVMAPELQSKLQESNYTVICGQPSYVNSSVIYKQVK